ncbi:MAG: long-chain-fatty-acid--CoA ligase [Gammaproteobacteria bacterium]|nr:long-chain-fatty-acid--CoA ligase [Gammaproteobacteria bacterium]
MLGLMMEAPLTITALMRHALSNHADVEIVSVTADAPRHRCTYGDIFRRAGQLAGALADLGMRPGDRVATLAWNDYRHLELYYGVSCSGGVLHTINPRLFEEQIVYIANHAEDRWLFVDPAFLPRIESLRDELPRLERIIVLSDDAHVPATRLSDVVSYEAFIAGTDRDFRWPDLDERTASALCYTSGTTGHPKGVLYEHRSTVLHAFASALPDALHVSMRDALLPVVPMFHANAWGAPYAAVLAGARLVMPGPKLGDAPTLYELIENERVNVALGVPTVWLGLLDWCERERRTMTSLERVVVGGSACPPAVIERFRAVHGASVRHAWGMTEMSPLGTVHVLRPSLEQLPEAERARVEAKQGRAIFGVEMKIVGDDGEALAHDGRTFGVLKVRGPWICREYYKAERASDAHDADGWFATGDVATIDADGYMQITDRSKDVIKSGGEWISSIDLENTAVGHPAVAEAAVVAVPDPKWQERPLLVVVPKAGAEISREEMLAWFEDKVAKWWIPDDVVFVTELPHTATGKISKVVLREQLATLPVGEVERADRR